MSKATTQKKTKIGFQDRYSLNAGQKYYRMHSAILSTCIKLPHVFKALVLSILSGCFRQVSEFTVVYNMEFVCVLCYFRRSVHNSHTVEVGLQVTESAPFVHML